MDYDGANQHALTHLDHFPFPRISGRLRWL
jgi:hypothetical protein